MVNAFVPILLAAFLTDLSHVAWSAAIPAIVLIAASSTFLGLFVAVSVSEAFEALDLPLYQFMTPMASGGRPKGWRISYANADFIHKSLLCEEEPYFLELVPSPSASSIMRRHRTVGGEGRPPIFAVYRLSR